jgi:hypothetical protein
MSFDFNRIMKAIDDTERLNIIEFFENNPEPVQTVDDLPKLTSGDFLDLADELDDLQDNLAIHATTCESCRQTQIAEGDPTALSYACLRRGVDEIF